MRENAQGSNELGGGTQQDKVGGERLRCRCKIEDVTIRSANVRQLEVKVHIG